ncbi:MAG: bifunctional sugar-1-phosphate nucleotidylyltransferase/acetyltransferase [Candidatus Aenigmatarchaeota archaeon]
MKAVIMAAGVSTRTFPITVTTPKPLIRIANKEILARTLENLSGLVDEVLLIVGYKIEMIKTFLQDKDYGFKITLVEQKEQLGTGHALLQCRPYLDGRFISMGGDDYFSRRDIEKLLQHDYAILTKKVDDPSKFGVCFADRGVLKKIVEKPKIPVSYQGNTACYVFDNKIFDALKRIKKSTRGEYELTDAINLLAETVDIKVVDGEDWVAGSTFPHLFQMNNFHLDNMEPKIDGEVSDKAHIEGKVFIGRGTRVLPGACIEGPVMIGENCVIGPNCHIRPYTTIGDNCKIRNGAEIKGSIIGNVAKGFHQSYVGNSILGNDVNIAAGTIITNWRHDNQNIKTWINGQLVDTGCRKFGAVIADGCRLGAGTIIYPGRKMWPGKTTLPGEIVKNDIK